MKNKPIELLSPFIKFCPKSGRPVKALNKWIIPVFGMLALAWILIRVIPKPTRITYPCMNVAVPFASTLIIQLSSLLASVLIFKKAFQNFERSKYFLAGTFLFAGLVVGITSMIINNQEAYAETFLIEAKSDYNYKDPLGPNKPIGAAKGILPGRVVWIHNPDATNEDCNPAAFFDGYFLDKNADQFVIDRMVTSGILNVSGEPSEEKAWESIFKYFNATHHKGEVGYQEGEKIFIKINAVHAWETQANLSIKYDKNYGYVDTSPQVILSVLRQLINNAGVPQEAIFIGDPFTNIFKHIHDKLSAEFPNVHYMSDGDHENREKMQQTNTAKMHFSDKGAVLPNKTDTYFDCTINADYVLSIPAMKGHRGGGVTFFAKNHFGTNTGTSASHMHAGLVRAVNGDPIRDEYRQYRVLVDIMSYEHLGGKNLIYIGDFLWGTSMEHLPPQKFQSAPFNNDWSSSVLVSLDPVAISSVALDILQEEFKVEDKTADPPRYIYVHFTGVDDYLHQAASSDWWPEGMVYDPEGDGTPIQSLGVHEHWNDPISKQYSRNLGKDSGIELIYQEGNDNTATVDQFSNSHDVKLYTSSSNSMLNVVFNMDLKESSDLRIYTMSGRLVQHVQLSPMQSNIAKQVTLNNLVQGVYAVTIRSGNLRLGQTIRIQ